MSSKSSTYKVLPRICLRKDLVKFTYNNQFYFIALPTNIPIFLKYLRWFGIIYEFLLGWNVNLLALRENNPRSGLIIYFMNKVIHYLVTPP